MEYMLIFLVNLIYLPTLWYGVVSDDGIHLVVSPYNLKKTKAFSIILHLTIAEYIYIAFGCNPISLMAAVLFSVHPMAVQVPVWISARQYGINALLFLMVWKFSPIGVLAYIPQAQGIVTLIFTPLVFMGTKFWYLTIACPLLVWMCWKKIIHGVKGKIDGSEIEGGVLGKVGATPALPKDFDLLVIKPRKLILVVKTYWYYFLGCMLPFKNGFYNSYLATFGSSRKASNFWYSFNRHFWGGMFAIILMLYFWISNFHNNIGAGIILFVVALIPFSNFITVQQWTTPRYAYLPLIGFQVALITLLSRLWDFGIIAGITGLLIIGGLFVFYLERLLKVLRHYRAGNVDMYYYEALEFPDNPRIWYFRYGHMLNQNNPVMAWAEAAYGLKHNPEDCQLWFGMSCASFELGDMNAAEQFLKKSEESMMLTDRKDFQHLVNEMRARIQARLEQKFKVNQPFKPRAWPPK